MFSISEMILLFSLANSMSPAKIRAEDLVSFTEDVSEVVESHPEYNLFPNDKYGKFKTKKLLLVWTAFESGGRASALGDAGQACGRGQLHQHYWYGYSCQQILDDGKLGLQLTLRTMKDLSDRFHSVKIGLAAFAGGNQYKSIKVQKIALNRLKTAGL